MKTPFHDPLSSILLIRVFYPWLKLLFFYFLELYKCKWSKCTFGTKIRDVLHYHVDYHGYLTNLKGLGTNFVESNELPSCHTSDIDPIPIRDQPYRCDWINCDTKFNQIHNYIYHVLCHSQGEPTVRKEGNKSLLCCLWSGKLKLF